MAISDSLVNWHCIGRLLNNSIVRHRPCRAGLGDLFGLSKTGPFQSGFIEASQ